LVSDHPPKIPDGDGGVLELGSGAGAFASSLLTPFVRMCFSPQTSTSSDARHLPGGSLKAIVMTDVFITFPNPMPFSGSGVCGREVAS
jgi:hypothetical protein